MECDSHRRTPTTPEGTANCSHQVAHTDSAEASCIVGGDNSRFTELFSEKEELTKLAIEEAMTELGWK